MMLTNSKTKSLVTLLVKASLLTLLTSPVALFAIGPEWSQTNWSGGSGQNSWSDPTQYQSDDGNAEIDNPVGMLKIKNDVNLGDGSDGALTVNSADSIINNYAYLVADVSSGTNSITIVNGAAFSVGDEILIIQMHNPDSSSPGRYEFRTIQSIVGGTSITLDSNLTYDYFSDRSSVNDTVVDTPGNNLNTNTSYVDTNSSIAQIVRIPHYTNVTVNSGASIVPESWNGLLGGIVIFRARGKVYVANGGSIQTDGKGFRGGAHGGSDGYRGEGWRGGNPRGGYNNAELARRVQMYGGGGCFVNGAGGGYGTAGTLGDTYGGRPATAGMVYGDAALNRLYFGGGGAGGHPNSGKPHGGNGGGIIFITADSITTLGTVSSDGQDGYAVSADQGHWGAGGGAGGVVFLRAGIVEIGTNLVHANGGVAYDGFNANGEGGDGGSGRIRIDYVTLNGSTTPAPNLNIISVSDSTYVVSSVFDMTSFGSNISGPYRSKWNATYNTGTVDIRLRTSTSQAMSGASDWALCDTLSNNTKLAGLSDITAGERYAQYRILLKRSGSSTPEFDSLGIEFNLPPSNFSLVSPHAIEVSQTPLLDWGDASDSNTDDTVTYKVEIDDNSDFSSLTHRSAALTTSQYTVPAGANLQDNTRYFWRVFAFDTYPDSTLSTDTMLFYTDVANNPPTPPQPLNFSNNDERQPLDSLGWTRNDPDPGDTLTYHVLVDDTSSFASPEIDTSFTLTTRIALQDVTGYANLADDKKYYIIVEADDPDGLNSGFTDLRAFYCNKVNDTVSIPYNLAPANGIPFDSSGYISWEVTDGDSVGNTPDTHTYTLQISVNPNFIPLISNNPGLTVDSIRLDSVNNYNFLLDGTTYYWRVQATDNHGLSGPMTDGTNNFQVIKNNKPPSAVTLISPTNGQEAPTVPLLDWSDATDPNQDSIFYHVEVATYSDFATIVFDTAGLRSSQYQVDSTDNLQGNSVYYWRVFAKDFQGDSTVSADTFSFSTENNPPSAFSLSLPVQGSEVNLTPLLDWADATDPDPPDISLTYIVELDTTSSFSTILLRKTTTASQYQIQSADGLVDNTSYYWRVYAKDTYPDSTLCNAVFVMYTDQGNNIPSLPTPLRPVNNTELAMTDSIGWTRNDPDPGDTLRYNIRLSLDVSFTTIVASKTNWLGESIALQNLDNAANLLDDVVYYWQVEAHDPSGASSGYTQGTDYFYCNQVNDTPSTPFNLYPQTNTTISPTDYLRWHATDGDSLGLTPDVLAYTIVVDNNPDFSSPIGITSGISADSVRVNTLTNAANLIDNIQYFWKIYATDNHGVSGGVTDGTHNFWFNISNSAPTAPSGLTPTAGNVVVPTSNFSWTASIDSDPYDTSTYVMHVSEDNTFTTLIAIDTTKLTTVQVNTLAGYTKFKTETTYFWRVKAFDNQGAESGWAGGATQSIIYRSTSPTVPQQISPINDKIYFPTEPIHWHVSSDPDAGVEDTLFYVLQISATSDFTTPLASDTGIDTVRILENLPGYGLFIDDSRYFWRISSFDNHGATSTWSITEKFLLDKSNSAPTIPTIIFPLDSQVAIKSSLFSWNKSNDSDPGNTVTYNILSATDSLFTDTVLSVTALVDTTVSVDSLLSKNTIQKWDYSQTPEVDTGGFLDNRFYFWKIVGVDNRNAASPYSIAQQFFCNTVNDTPGVPYTLQPNFGALTFPTQFLSWSVDVTPEFLDTTRFIIQVAEDSLFTSMLSVDTITELTQIQINSLNGHANFVDETYLYWRVKSYDLMNNSHGFSKVANLLYSTSNSAPTAPTGLYPTDSVALLNPTDLILWNKSNDQNNDSIYYSIWIDDQLFDSTTDTSLIAIRIANFYDTRVVLNQMAKGYDLLQHNTVYFWRVQARDEHYYNSAWSTLGMFRFNSTSPTVPDSLFPKDSTQISTSDFLRWNRAIDNDAGLTDTLNYVVMVDDNAHFVSPVSVDTVQLDTMLYLRDMQGVNDYNDDTYYFWKVKSLDDHGKASEFSLSSLFYFNRANSIPDTPNTLKPTLYVSIRPFQNLTWKATDPDINDTLTFLIEIAKDSTFNTISLIKGNWTTPYIRPMDFSGYQNVFVHDSIYFWRIKSYDQHGAVSAYSKIGAFKYDTKDDLATAPTIVSPSFGSYVVGGTKLQWKNSEDLDDTLLTYHIDIATDTIFSNIIAYKDSIPEGTDTLLKTTSVTLSSLINFDSLTVNSSYFLRVYPLSKVDTTWVAGNNSDIWKIWCGDSTILGNFTISSVTVITPKATSNIANKASSLDSMVLITFPDSTVKNPTIVKITEVPILGTIGLTDTSLITTSDTSLSRMQSSITMGNKYAVGDERTYYVKEKAYHIDMYDLDNPNSPVVLLDSAILQISYNDTNNNNMVDGEERIPVSKLKIFKLNELKSRWERTTSNAVRKQEQSKKKKRASAQPINDKSLSHSLTSFGIFTILAYAPMVQAFDNFKVYPNPIIYKSLREKVAKISYRLRDSAEVQIRIYSETGGLVWKKEIAPGQYGGAPSNNDAIIIPWDVRNTYGRLLGNGMYVVNIYVKPKTGGVFNRKQYIGVIK